MIENTRNSEYRLPIVTQDDWLKEVEPQINARFERYKSRLEEIQDMAGSLEDFSNAHHYYGFHRDNTHRGWWFRDWLPGAKQVNLMGDFNDWNQDQLPLIKDKWGCWSIFISDDSTNSKLSHGSLVKIRVLGADGVWQDRIPTYIRRVIQDEQTKDYCGQLWYPDHKFSWWGEDEFELRCVGSLIIYECHVGMASEKNNVCSYKEFTQYVLPRVKHMGYNTVQIMAIAEHPYYGSFGYQVSNLFAPSSRFGTPEELKELVRTAHSMGIGVIMDLVHSHYVKNTNEGINRLDGTDNLYSPLVDGDHPDWDSKLYDYGKCEVQQLLLSNIKYWMDEFHFDGFRFDGVGSMLYRHHGHSEFGSYESYFGDQVNEDAVLYLTLANKLAHTLKPSAVTIAEDVSGMPGLTSAIEDGGMGFNYRLAMSIPDFWIDYLKNYKDEDWDVSKMWEEMTNRKPCVGTVAYCESHDQALVGDKTIAFRLMDKDMYTDMNKGSHNPVIDRGIALHKMIRLFTIILGGNAYMTFMGNEFGHPEWIDFPRKDNDWSYKYARRQWSLADSPFLRYQDLMKFDRAMVALVKNFHILRSGYAYKLLEDKVNQTIAFEQGGLVFVFNWSPSHSLDGYKIPVPVAGKYRIVLNSDSVAFGGFARIDPSTEYFSSTQTNENGSVQHFIQIYNTSRTALVFERID